MKRSLNDDIVFKNTTKKKKRILHREKKRSICHRGRHVKGNRGSVGGKLEHWVGQVHCVVYYMTKTQT